MKILVIHGPNLNLLGTREPEIYGMRTLDEVNAEITAHAKARGLEVATFQSNHEGEIIDRIQHAESKGFAAIVLNPGAYTHTSVAIYDAIRGTRVPVVEVHISNLHAREDMRRRSITARACVGTITGFGIHSYILGIDAVASVLNS